MKKYSPNPHSEAYVLLLHPLSITHYDCFLFFLLKLSLH